MANPTENEEINEELTTDELKSVSGGIVIDTLDRLHITVDDVGTAYPSFIPPGSGSGMTKDDYRKANRLVAPADGDDPGTKTPTFI